MRQQFDISALKKLREHYNCQNIENMKIPPKYHYIMETGGGLVLFYMLCIAAL